MSEPDTGDPLHILIAEDDALISAVLAAVVADLGYRPLTAVDGQQALDLARATWPALVLTDLMMPRLSGTALIAALRAEATAAGRAPVPVILMTAAGPGHTQGVDADAVLSKPFDLGELERVIARMLNDAGPDTPGTSRYPPGSGGPERGDAADQARD